LAVYNLHDINCWHNELPYSGRSWYFLPITKFLRNGICKSVLQVTVQWELVWSWLLRWIRVIWVMPRVMWPVEWRSRRGHVHRVCTDWWTSKVST